DQLDLLVGSQFLAGVAVRELDEELGGRDRAEHLGFASLVVTRGEADDRALLGTLGLTCALLITLGLGGGCELLALGLGGVLLLGLPPWRVQGGGPVRLDPGSALLVETLGDVHSGELRPTVLGDVV